MQGVAGPQANLPPPDGATLKVPHNSVVAHTERVPDRVSELPSESPPDETKRLPVEGVLHGRKRARAGRNCAGMNCPVFQQSKPAQIWCARDVPAPSQVQAQRASSGPRGPNILPAGHREKEWEQKERWHTACSSKGLHEERRRDRKRGSGRRAS